jgi:hypothetical protein
VLLVDVVVQDVADLQDAPAGVAAQQPQGDGQLDGALVSPRRVVSRSVVAVALPRTGERAPSVRAPKVA